MSSEKPTEKETNPFAKIFEQSQKEEQQQALKKGMLVEGRVVDVIEEEVFVDIGIKTEGKIPLKEFFEPPEIGDQVAGIIKGKESDTEIYILSKAEADARKGWDVIKDAASEEMQVQGKIESEVKNKGFHVIVEGVKMFLPVSQLGIKYASIEELRKIDLGFKILKLNDKKKTGIVSHKSVLEEINKEKWEALQGNVNVGDKVTGKVTKIANFGVFLLVHGIEGLLRQNDISYKKYAPFKQYFVVGQEVEVQILAVEPENNRLSLGIKQLYEDPWVWAARELEKDMVVRGLVTSLTNFGAFVELKEGLEGLIHTSELSWAKKPPHPKEILKKGEEVDSVVLDIDLERKRLSLGLKQLKPNPWENLSENVMVNNVLEGKVTGITKYGAFVEIENGIEGLIHVTDITWDDKVKDPTSVLQKGQTVKYIILDIDLESNRISCGLKQLQEHPYEGLKKKYPPGTIIEGIVKSIVNFGVFIELEPGFEGLVHISQIPDGKSRGIEDEYQIGETVKAVILKIEPDSKKISLSIKDFDKALEREEIAKYLIEDEPSRSSLGNFLNIKK